MDKLAVAYWRSSDINTEILTTVSASNASKTNLSYDIPDESEHVLVKEPYKEQYCPDAFVADSAVSGSDGSGRFMVALTDHWVVPGNFTKQDVLARIMQTSGSNVYLPLIIR